MAGIFERRQVDTLCRRLAEPPNRIIALFGPRRTGKTTIAQQALRRIDRHSRYLAIDEPDSAAVRPPFDARDPLLRVSHERNTPWLVRNWEAARLEAERRDGFVLVLDEIQKIPQWSATVKGLWDAQIIA